MLRHCPRSMSWTDGMNPLAAAAPVRRSRPSRSVFHLLLRHHLVPPQTTANHHQFAHTSCYLVEHRPPGGRRGIPWPARHSRAQVKSAEHIRKGRQASSLGAIASDLRTRHKSPLRFISRHPTSVRHERAPSAAGRVPVRPQPLHHCRAAGWHRRGPGALQHGARPP